MNKHQLPIGGKKRRLEETSHSVQLKKVKLNARLPFKNNCNILIELPSKAYHLPQYEKYIQKIEDTSYIFVNKKTSPNELISLLTGFYKDEKYIKCNLVLDNYHSDFTKPFHRYNKIKIVKSLMSELILSPRYDIYNLKIGKNNIDSIISLIHAIKFTKRKTDFLDDFKRLFKSAETADNADNYSKTVELELSYKSSNVQSILKDLLKSHKKQAINTIKLKEKQALDKLTKQKERRKRLEEKKRLSVTKEKLKKPVIVATQKPESLPETSIEEKSITVEKSTPHVEQKPAQNTASEPEEETLTEEELDKHALLTITKNMTALTTLKKTKPYKIVKIFIRLPIKKYSTTIINELISSNKTSANIVIVSYINLQDTKVFFKNELKMKALGDSTEREFKVLAIGGGINDVLITLTDIRKNMMLKMTR